MENRLNFEAISDDELAKIVGGGYLITKAWMMFFIGSMVIMMEIPNNYLNGWVV